MSPHAFLFAGIGMLALTVTTLQADSVVHDTSAEFATGTFSSVEDTGSGSSPSVQMVRNLLVGDGRNGAPPASGTLSSGYARVSGTAGASTISFTDVSSAASIVNGDYVLLHQSAGPSGSSGHWEIAQVVSGGGAANGTWTLASTLQRSYTYSSQWNVGGNCCPAASQSYQVQAQAVKIWQYTGGTISGNLNARDWDGRAGGILAIMSNGTLNISGTVYVNGAGGGSTTNGDGCCAGWGGGFRGGFLSGDGSGASKGEGHYGQYWHEDRYRNYNGGGGGWNDDYGNGGGGGNGTAGGQGEGRNGNNAEGGLAVGASDLSTMFFGGGGGGSKKNNTYRSAGGGSGAGIILIFAKTLNVTGYVTCNGGAGGSGDTGGGGGAGGSVYLKAQSLSFTNDRIQTLGGSNGGSNQGYAGAGGKGRIRLDTVSSSGSISSGYYGSLYPATIPYQTAGTYTSAAIPITGASALNTLAWTASGSGTLQFRTRTSSNGSNWSAWSGYLAGSGSQITSPVNEWIQYEASYSGTGSSSPAVTSVTINYTTNIKPTDPANPSPQDSAYVADATPLLSWDPSTDADLDPITYDVSLDDNADFGSPIVNQSSTGSNTSYQAPTLTSGITYYWRVRAWDTKDFNANSATWSFIVDTEAPPSLIFNSLLWDLNQAAVTRIFGSGEDGTSVTLYDDLDTPIAGSATWDGNGNFTFIPTAPLASQARFYARAEDAAANMSLSRLGMPVFEFLENIYPDDTVYAGAGPGRSLRLEGDTRYNFKIAVNAGGTVSISAWVRKNASYSGSGPSITLTGLGISGTGSATAVLTAGPATWQKLTVTGSPNTAGVVNLEFQTNSLTENSISWIDDVIVSQ